MPRLSQVSRADAHSSVLTMYNMLFGERDPVAEPGTATGTPGDWWTVVAQAPDVFRHCVAGFGLYRSEKRELPPKLRELGQTRAGFAIGSQFVFSQHCKSMRSVGFGEEHIEALSAWAISDVWTPAERAVLAYTDELVLQAGRVQDATFENLRSHLSEVGILELTYITLTYQLHAVMCRALRLEYDDVDERIVEVPAPHDAANRDVMADISGPGEE